MPQSWQALPDEPLLTVSASCLHPCPHPSPQASFHAASPAALGTLRRYLVAAAGNGAAATLLAALLLTSAATRLRFWGLDRLLLCPASAADLGTSVPICDTARVADGLFVRKSLGAHPGLLGGAARLLLSQGAAAAVKVSDAQLHACVMGLFASFIAPFGGFLASGFKRAFRIKDFGAAIPGHGGFTDRM